MTPGAVYTVWGASLLLGAVVLLVVWALLHLVLRTAQRIETGTQAIWVAGQGVANNTIHIALLRRTNHTAARILEVAGGVLRAVTAIRGHAQACPRCPACARESGS